MGCFERFDVRAACNDDIPLLQQFRNRHPRFAVVFEQQHIGAAKRFKGSLVDPRLKHGVDCIESIVVHRDTRNGDCKTRATPETRPNRNLVVGQFIDDAPNQKESQTKSAHAVLLIGVQLVIRQPDFIDLFRTDTDASIDHLYPTFAATHRCGDQNAIGAVRRGRRELERVGDQIAKYPKE